jgi:type I restriction enzyme S subunit
MKRWALPEGWREIRIADVAHFVRGVTFKPSQKIASDQEGAVACLRTKNIQECLDVSDLIYVTPTVVRNPAQYVQPGDTLISSANSRELLGKCCFADRIEGDFVIGAFIALARPDRSAVDPLYFYHFFRSPYIQAQLRDLARKTTGIANLPLSQTKELLIPLPPPDEQRRIVGRIEALARRLEEAKGLRRAARQEAEALLPAAVDEGLGRAAVQGWGKIKLRSIVEVRTGQVDPTLPQYRDLPHVNGQRIESATCRLLPFRTAAEDGMKSGKYLFEPGDILYSKIRPYLRKAAQVDFAGLCSADVYPLAVVSEEIDSRFLMWSLVAQPFSEYANALSLRARMPKLNRQQLLSYDLAVPPLDEQRRIVAYLDSVRAKGQALLRLQEETQRELDALVPSVLDRAFRGEL